MRWERVMMLALAAVVASATASAPRRAHAQAKPSSQQQQQQPSQPPQPWVAGVTEEQKARAKAALDAGNRRFVERDYAAALVTYREAVAMWDHPAIRFNIVRCLIQLDRPLEAYDNLRLALAYGAAPLEEAVYAEARMYEKLLTAQIGELEVRCTQPGTKLTLDGKALAAACPGTVARRVAPGAHQVVGEAEGFLTRTLEVIVVGGARKSVGVALVPLSEVNVTTRRWRGWVPWTVFGAGLAVVGVGALVDVEAASEMDAYDRNVAARCGRSGCAGAELDALLAQKRTAELENRVGVGLLAAGAAATVAGAVMLYLNQPRSRYPERGAPPVAVRALPGGGAVLALDGRF